MTVAPTLRYQFCGRVQNGVAAVLLGNLIAEIAARSRADRGDLCGTRRTLLVADGHRRPAGPGWRRCCRNSSQRQPNTLLTIVSGMTGKNGKNCPRLWDHAPAPAATIQTNRIGSSGTNRHACGAPGPRCIHCPGAPAPEPGATAADAGPKLSLTGRSMVSSRKSV